MSYTPSDSSKEYKMTPIKPMEQIFSAQQIRVPTSLPTIMKNYTKEVLRFQPNDIVSFSHLYFQAIADGDLAHFLKKVAPKFNDDDSSSSDSSDSEDEATKQAKKEKKKVKKKKKKEKKAQKKLEKGEESESSESDDEATKQAKKEKKTMKKETKKAKKEAKKVQKKEKKEKKRLEKKDHDETKDDPDSSDSSSSSSDSENDDKNQQKTAKPGLERQQSLHVGNELMKGGKLVLKGSGEGKEEGQGKGPIDPAARKRGIFKMLFEKYDDDKSGTIESGELVNLMVDLKWTSSPEAVEKALNVLDKDRNGTIDLDEFLKWTDYAWTEHALKEDEAKGKSKSINDFEHHSVGAMVEEEDEEEEDDKTQ